MRPSTRRRLAVFSSPTPPISSLIRYSAAFNLHGFPSPRRNRASKSAAKLKRWPLMMPAAMFGGGRSGLFTFSKAAAFPNPSLSFRSTPPPPPKPNRLCFQCARRSSQADSNASDYGDVKGEDSMKEYMSKAKEEAEKAKEKTEEETSSAAEKAKDKTKKGANAARDKASDAAEKTRESMKEGVEKTKETAQAAKEKSRSMAEKAKETAAEGAEKSKEGASKVEETAQTIGEKAKQTVQGAWEAAKETTHKIKETVVGKEEEEEEAARDALKDVGKAPPREDVRAARKSSSVANEANNQGREKLKD